MVDSGLGDIFQQPVMEKSHENFHFIHIISRTGDQIDYKFKKVWCGGMYPMALLEFGAKHLKVGVKNDWQTSQ